MLVTTHTIATIGLGHLMNLHSFKDWFLAFLFGVFIDLDHLKIFRKKYRLNGDFLKFFTKELPMHSFLHAPISLIWIAPLAFYLKAPVILASWGLHIFLDYLVDGCRQPFWPFSHYTLTKGLLRSFTIYEFLFTPLTGLALWLRQ